MTLSLGEILIFLLFLSWLGYIFQSLRVRELALQAARKACQRDGLQLLDETVSMRRLSLSRDDRGRWRIWRQFSFEYSFNGVERERGSVIMLGARLQALVISEHTLH